MDFGKILILRLIAITIQNWNISGQWKIIPLGNFFFMSKLSSKDEFIQIWARVVRFTKWSPEFDHKNQISSRSLQWVGFPGLKQ